MCAMSSTLFLSFLFFFLFSPKEVIQVDACERASIIHRMLADPRSPITIIRQPSLIAFCFCFRAVVHEARVCSCKKFQSKRLLRFNLEFCSVRESSSGSCYRHRHQQQCSNTHTFKQSCLDSMARKHQVRATSGKSFRRKKKTQLSRDYSSC